MGEWWGDIRREERSGEERMREGIITGVDQLKGEE